MSQGLTTRQRVETGVRIDPRVVLGSYLLQLSEIELEQAVEAEVAENPAIERLQDDFDPVTDDQILRSVAPAELKMRPDDYERQRSVSGDDESDSWIDLAVGGQNLQNYVVAQMLPKVPNSLAWLARYVAESLNAKGYLDEPDEEIALATGASLEDVQVVVSVLQKCEPLGIGARNLPECLLLQLQFAESVEERLARVILKSCLDDFLAKRTMRISRKYGVMPSLVEAAFIVVGELCPYPGESMAQSPHSAAARISPAAPDLIIARTDAGWTVQVVGVNAQSLYVSRSYQKRSEELKGSGNAVRDERRHVNGYVRRAQDFIACVEQRGQTLRSIGEYLLREQTGFMNTGSYQFLRPLTRSQMASDLGLHESTVSRATAGKFVQLPGGTMVSFEIFFKPALRVQKMIEEILASENPDDPLSDDRIAEILAERGVHIARRTVNKYRDRTKLLSSRKRKTA
jgi:RNA polymerase sigma-54 factor